MPNLTLFNDVYVRCPETEGIKYAGSKLKLIPPILQLTAKINPKTILDGFSGTTRVSQAFAATGYAVICNDAAIWSRFFGECYLLSRDPASHYEELIRHLNGLKGKDGWLTQYYGGDAGDKRSALKYPWQKRNTQKADAIREEIERLKLNRIERAVAITSLVLALDKVDSTLGHYASYLQNWSPRSYNALVLAVPRIIPKENEHSVYQRDIFDLLKEAEVDLAYFDPPYGSNNEKMPPSRVRYSAYYHVWTSICLFDNPAIFGRVRRRVDSSDVTASSVFEDFKRGKSGRFVAVEAIDRLLRETKARHILLSYSSGGRATAEELGEAIKANGRLIDLLEIDYKRNVMAEMTWTNEWVREADTPNREFLFLIEKR
jgi:adenine-specific DNA-methyltransferase